MKVRLFFINLLTIVSLVATTGYSQITLSPASIPQVGDTLRQMVDNMPVGVDAGLPGADQVWDFSALQGMFVLETIFKNSREGKSSGYFPSANAVIFLTGGIENYFSLTGNEVRELGVAGTDPLNLNLDLVGKFIPPLASKRASMRYGDKEEKSTSLVFPIPASTLPDTLFADFPFAPDSVRLRVQIDREEVADAWGLLLFREQMFEVLRVKRVEKSVSRIDIKSGFFPWIDISDLLGIDELGNQSSISYFYYDETHKEPIVTLTADMDNNIQRAEYIYNELTAADFMTDIPQEKGLHVYPNPTYGLVALNFVGLDTGRYRVRIMNILGVSNWEEKFEVDGYKRVMVDVSHLEPGTYLYSLIDDRNNNIMLTKRLIIVRP